MENYEEEIPELVDEKIEKPLRIYPYQKEHFKTVLSILQNGLGYKDVSSFGCGKTIIAIAVAKTFNMGIGVFGPKTVLPNWKTQCSIYGVPVYWAMTYNSLRGTEKGGVNHDLLERDEDDFYATDTIEKCARNGLLIIYDECHFLKNENSQLDAAQTLSREAARLARLGYNIRIGALSATPADKKENVTSILKILGIVTSKKLYKYNRSTKCYVSVGLQEAVNQCNRYDPDTTFHIMCRPLNKTTSKTICHELYTRILKKHITSSMPKPPIDAEKDIKNLFAILPPEDVERIKEGAMLFSSATSYRHETGEVNFSKISWGDVILSRREIDSSKVFAMCRLSQEQLERDPNCKIVLYYTYKRDMARAAELLNYYNPIVLNGEITKEEKRTELIEKFQRNDNEYRVFISNPKVGGVGIDLDDIYGNHQRYMFIAPSYMFIDQFQATGRIHRKNTKSKAVIRFVYSREFPYETGLLTSIAEKSRVARDMIMSNQNDIIFPGELDEEIERYPGEVI